MQVFFQDMQLFLISKQSSVLERWQQLLRDKQPQAVGLSVLTSGRINRGDILIVHLSSIGMDLCSQAFIYKQQYPSVHLIICTDVPAEKEGLQVLQSGANGYVNTYVTESLFAEVLACVEAGNIWAGPELLQSLLKQLLDNVPATAKKITASAENLFEKLSVREKDVLAVLVSGASNKEIAKELDITERTVKAHLSSIFQKTGVQDRISLILKARDQSEI